MMMKGNFTTKKIQKHKPKSCRSWNQSNTKEDCRMPKNCNAALLNFKPCRSNNFLFMVAMLESRWREVSME